MKFNLGLVVSNYPCACGVIREENLSYETLEEAHAHVQEIKKFYPDSYGWISDADGKHIEWISAN